MGVGKADSPSVLICTRSPSLNLSVASCGRSCWDGSALAACLGSVMASRAMGATLSIIREHTHLFFLGRRLPREDVSLAPRPMNATAQHLLALFTAYFAPLIGPSESLIGCVSTTKRLPPTGPAKTHCIFTV